MAIYCVKCGATHECSVCPVCHGLGCKPKSMTTDELRAKFDAWWNSDEPTPTFNCRLDSPLRWALAGWYAAHASRDAEVEALKKRIEDAPIYYIPTEKPTDQDGWVQVIGSVKAINNMRGKHVRLVIDDAMREGK